MADFTPLEQQAWKALRGTRRELQPVVPRTARLKLGTGGGSSNSGGTQRVFTGMSIAGALASLTAAGWTAADARETIRRVVVQRFRKLAGGWSGYCNGDGWLRDLLECDPALAAEIAKQHKMEEMLRIARGFKDDGIGGMPDLNTLFTMGRVQTQLRTELGKTGAHPAVDLLTLRYGYHPALARAVMYYSEVMPWWAHLLICVMVLIAAGIFILALTDPHSAVFENDSVGGAGPLHYVFLPLFALAMTAAEVWMIKDTPRRERAWREQLAEYAQAGTLS